MIIAYIYCVAKNVIFCMWFLKIECLFIDEIYYIG